MSQSTNPVGALPVLSSVQVGWLTPVNVPNAAASRAPFPPYALRTKGMFSDTEIQRALMAKF